ncbi:MAG TPA: pyridoxal phosphate-dependent aminotransferase family protein [Blastocatellia bacterium]|nr:pyridoxal phosphate-dependent aminotransferase family protein [Blastocatellia bacterium]
MSQEPVGDVNNLKAFRKHLGMFVHPRGAHLTERTRPLGEWVRQRTELSTWPYARTLEQSPSTVTRLKSQNGIVVEGLNFGSQDYLGLSSHPSVHEAALKALCEFGPHAAASPMLQGNTEISRRLEKDLSDFLRVPHVLLFPTGWAAGFGAIVGLVRPGDHVVIDQLSHACLMQGARAATDCVHYFRHNDVEDVRARLEAIRAKDARNGILVVTEGLFSMDSDSPNIFAIQEVCREFQAVLMVDVAHDFGAQGPGGSGQIGLQGMLGRVDLVMGSFSKTFSSNGGFLATQDLSVRQYVSIYGGSHTFSNALSPVQAGVVIEAMRIVRSEEGDELRAKARLNIDYLRSLMRGEGMFCYGGPSNVVPVSVGDETLAKWTSRFLEEHGLLANLVEFPAVPKGTARFRFQVMASHTHDQIEEAVRIFRRSLDSARDMTSAPSRALAEC